MAGYQLNPQTGAYEWDTSDGSTDPNQSPYGNIAPAAAPAPGTGTGYALNPQTNTYQPSPNSAPVSPAAPPAPGSPSTVGPFAGTFTAPTRAPFIQAPTFTGPSAAEALNDPGYQFRLSQGKDAIQRAASNRGTLNDSGTISALTDYAENSASQEYQNVWNRDYSGTFVPQFQSWQQQNPWNQNQYTTDYANAWNQFTNSEDLWKYNTTNALTLAGQ